VTLVVLDTNVLVSAIRSRHGASFEILSKIGTEAFDIAVSVPLVLEYEDAMLRHLPETSLEETDIGDIIDYACNVAVRQEIFFLWRPFLKDPGDDLVLEAAVAADCDVIITYNLRDFVGVDRFDLRTLSPGDFLNELRGAK
jgi:putative PIN family toxin of toxin-antitoxin system